MNGDLEGIVTLDKLTDHYKHCIRLSASNKINPKNAFDLQLIDYMQDLVSAGEDGQMNFKIASSALDVGAKIYSNRVDRIQSEAQKVASSILMALDGQNQKDKQSDSNLNDSNIDGDNTAASDALNESRDAGEDGAPTKAKKKKPTRNKNIKTVVEDTNTLDGKIEKIVLGDPFLDGLSRDYDMSCPAALICYNALTQPSCLLTIESNNNRKDYKDPKQPSQQSNLSNDHDTSSNDLVTLITKNANCAQIIRNNLNNNICHRLENFLFNDRSTKLSGLDINLDDSVYEDNQLNILNSGKQNGGAGLEHEFNPELYAENDYGDDHIGDPDSFAGDDENHAGDKNANDLIPNLDKIAATKPSDYGYSNDHPRLMNTWAGPHAWKAMKVPQTTKKDGVPKSARKRVKLEQKPIDFSEQFDPTLEKVADKDIRHSAQVIRRWKKPLKPQDHNLNEEVIRTTIVHTFMRPEDTYHCTKTAADALKLVDADHDYSKNNLHDHSASPGLGGFDDVHDDSDDEFRADPVVEGEVALYGAPINNVLDQGADMEFAGENLIEQPYMVAQVNIPFAKIAKKMDIRKLKRVMWDLLLPLERKNTTANQSIDQTNVTKIEQNVSEKGGDVTMQNSDLLGGDNSENNVTVLMNGEGDKDNDTSATIEATKKTVSPTPSESAVHLSFSNLYGELPVRVSSKMADDLSRSIAFVTLLHLANEKNLKLIPEEGLKDFIIEQDELV